MARVFASGFIGDLTTTGKNEWISRNGAAYSRVTSPVPTGERYAMRVTGLTSGTASRVGQQFASTVAEGTDIFQRFKFYYVTAPSADNTFAASGTSGSAISDVRLVLTSSGTIKLTETGTGTIATSSALTTSTWYTIELRTRRDATTPNAGADQVELRIDGVSIGSSSSVSIASQQTGFIIGGNLAGEAQTQGDWYFASCLVHDSTGSVHTSWPGVNARTTYLRPDGTGTYDEPTANGAATNWECVDEDSPDGTTTYANMSANSASWAASGSRLLVTLEASSVGGIGSSDTIETVGVGVVWSAATAAACTVQPGLRSGGSTVDVGTGRSITTTTDSFLDDATTTSIYAFQHTDPTDSNAWTTSKLDSLEIGGRGSDTSPNCRVTALWALVIYTPAAGAAGQPITKRYAGVPFMRRGGATFGQGWVH